MTQKETDEKFANYDLQPIGKSTSLATSQNNLSVLLNKKHNEIVVARHQGTAIDTRQQFQAAVVGVCVLLSFKQEHAPSTSDFDNLFNIYQRRFADITIQEFKLAFQMNLLGELGEKVNHYYSFGAEFMCEVLNRYKQSRSEAEFNLQKTKEKEQEAERENQRELAFLKNQIAILEFIKSDISEIEETGTLKQSVSCTAKIDTLGQIFDYELPTEADFIEINEQARNSIIGSLRKKRVELQSYERKNYECRDLNNQCARFVGRILETPQDTTLLKIETEKLFFIKIIKSLPNDELIKGIDENIKLFTLKIKRELKS